MELNRRQFVNLATECCNLFIGWNRAHGGQLGPAIKAIAFDGLTTFDRYKTFWKTAPSFLGHLRYQTRQKFLF